MQESGFDQGEVSSSGDVALVQINYEIWKPEFDKMKDIAEALNVRMSDLILMAEGNNVKTGPDLYRVPLISWVQAGNLKEVNLS